MIERISGRIALLVIAGATLLIAILGWFVLISPERSKASKLDSQIGATNVQLQQVTALLNGPVGRQSLVSLRLFKKAVPDQENISQILRQLSTYASTAGVEIDGITPSALVAGTGAETLPIALTVKGQYFGLRKFLQLLRSAADLSGDQVHATGRLYSIDSIQFQGGAAPGTGTTTQSGGVNEISASLALNAFIYAPTSVAAPVGTPPAASDTGTTTP